jgi:predicted Zn-dependent protease
VAESFAEKTKEEFHLEVKQSKPVKIGRLDAWRMQLEGGRKVANVTFIPYRGATWRITGFSRSDVAKRYLPDTLNAARSFRPLTAAQRDSIEVTRLSLVEARSGEDLAALGRRTGNAWDPSRTAVLNGVFANHRFEGGELVKIARAEPYSAKPPR